VQILDLLLPILIPIVGAITAFYTVAGDLLSLLSGQTAVGDFGEHLATAQGPIYDITRAIADWLMPGLSGLMSFMSTVVTNWNTGWQIVSNFFSGIVGNVTSVASTLWANLSGTFQTGVQQVSSIFSALPQHIQNLFAGAGAWLMSSGRSLIRGFIDGINSMIGSVGDAVGNVMEFAAGFFPHSPALRGPFSGPGWVQVADGGASLMEQFSKGAEAYRPELNFFGGNATQILDLSRTPPAPSSDTAPPLSGPAPFIGGNLIIQEAEDPLGSAGRLEAEYRRFRKK